ncbi:alpha/beta hydrolase [Petralouisia muris]|uniref:alpha/beta hydrolase n=1 Tax=Petralouisia muris TaxID=3032872 RepID=UPI0023B7EDA1|nr:alpha/beta hydrolase [Petralouisia muris]
MVIRRMEVKALKHIAAEVCLVCLLVFLIGCGAGNPQESVENTESTGEETAGDFGQQEERQEQPVRGAKESKEPYTAETPISEVISNPDFGAYGRLIFPADSGYYSGDTLGNLSLTWYSNIDPDKTVEIANYMKAQAEAGERIFYDIYTQEEKEADPAKEDTGLFFFRGNAGEKFALCSAGGGFAYVGAMQDSFPHALELSKKGYHAFALIYRPRAQTACEDLARAISFIFEHAEELEVDTECYSLWGGSAGARMAAWLGSYGPEEFGGNSLPRPGTVVMQYTGHSDYTENDPPTYACVGKNDGIANWRTMENRINALKGLGIDAEFHSYPGLGHGFGLGTKTAAEGWLDEAVAFWEKQMGK